MSGVPLVHNPAIWENLPNARMSGTARDVFDVLTSRQEPGGLVVIKQKDIAEKLGIQQSGVGRAIGDLRDLGILHARTTPGRYRINPMLAGYESLAHMVNTLNDPSTEVWGLRYDAGVRPPRRLDARAGTDFDPDPDGGEDAPMPEAQPFLRIAG
ncbi:hypothetical protein ACGFYQ_33960 [Streptomyces sp. NPDC048258]|uniref:hypothetical protein n=1 Tax=Streptomyces sp. NPDC048258 TaxID=3365527 RepID=UPI0037227CF3